MLLECAGVPLHPQLQGQSLAPVLRGEATSGKACALMEFKGWRNIRTSRYRYLCEADGREALYDLDCDPMQYRNVATDPAYADAL